MLIAFFPCGFTSAQTPPHVAATDPLSPEKQRTKFVLPEGFEIQLVVSEPDIGQPMNLNFDARGRLWISHSVEYPYPAQGEGVEPRGRFAGIGDHPPRDRVTIVESLADNGRAQGVTYFAKGLNIPIGQVPWGNGSEALVYSIPAIVRHTDTDGDGHADQSRKLYGRFGNVDTHGMASSFTPWIDGWIYGCHGFSNHSRIKDAAGHHTEMTSGNTYRFRPDGSRFEHFTFGQVNPFGMAFDPLGNLYDADCHSMPVYQLLRGASYPHFGQVAGPLGFGPTMINHNHGSTGICGVAYYAAKHYPAAYQDSLFICNPVTGRVHHDRLKRFGSTYQADTQPDFLRCDDPWFRPVDAALGPDGALYIADFYNAIIGHYEVPLEHPKRDRTRGRVWRIVYRGPKGNASPRKSPDLIQFNPQQLVDRLADDNLSVRTLATNWLVEGHPQQAVALLRDVIKTTSSPEQRAHGLWVIERVVGLTDEELTRLTNDPDRLVRVHLMKALAERADWNAAQFEIARQALSDSDAFVSRAAADALGRHPHPENWEPLLSTWNNTNPQDTHLIHTLKLALKSHFDSNAVEQLATQKLSAANADRLLNIASACSTPQAASFLLKRSDFASLDKTTRQTAVRQVARHGRPDQIAHLISQIRQAFSDKPHEQFALFLLVSESLIQRGTPPEKHSEMRAWFEELVPVLLTKIEEPQDTWTHQALPKFPNSAPPWGIRDRRLTNGQTLPMIDSISHGESLTGIYRSPSLKLPKELRFWMCGHNGHPSTNPPPVNHVRLRLLKSGEVIAKEFPPRNDTAQQFTWDLKHHVGQLAVFEIVDASTLNAYAWIAVGGFDPPLISVPDGETADAEVFATIRRFEMKQYAPRLIALAKSEGQSLGTRVAALRETVNFGAVHDSFPVITTLWRHPELSSDSRIELVQVLGQISSEESRRFLVTELAKAPAFSQREMALSLCQTQAGANALLAAVEQGKASARLFQDPAVKTQFDQLASTAAQKKVAEFLQGLPAVEQRLLELIADRRKSYPSARTDPARGKALFTKNCAACHKVGNEGSLIGPQLDGVGTRGLDRLLEDVIDPNRNVDAAFRTQTLITRAGQVITGLKRREEGKVLILADQRGKEIAIPLNDIEAMKESGLSLMPANFGEILKPQEVYDLLAYLLTLRTPEAKPSQASIPEKK